MKYVHGTDNFGFAEITDGAFGTPVMMEGITKFEMEVDQSTTKIYADNVSKAIITGAKVRSATATMYQIVQAYAEKALGYVKADNGMMTDTGKKPQHCIFFTSTETDADSGADTQVLHYLYSALAKEPKVERETDGEEVTPTELEIEYEAKESSFVVDANGAAVQYGYIVRTEENKALFDSFKTKVILPTDAVSK